MIQYAAAPMQDPLGSVEAIVNERRAGPERLAAVVAQPRPHDHACGQVIRARARVHERETDQLVDAVDSDNDIAGGMQLMARLPTADFWRVVSP